MASEVDNTHTRTHTHNTYFGGMNVISKKSDAQAGVRLVLKFRNTVLGFKTAEMTMIVAILQLAIIMMHERVYYSENF